MKEYIAEIMQNEELCATVQTPNLEEALREADHYLMMYGQDGPCEAFIYERKLLIKKQTQ